MSERNASPSTGPTTAEIPVVRPAGATPASAVDAPTVTATPEPPVPGPPQAAPVAQETSSVSVRPTPRGPRRGPLTVMGPWAPVAGGLLGLVLGGIAAAVLAGSAEAFEQRLAVVLVVLALGMLGAAGVLLADEVRVIRQQTREAAVRPQWVEATAGLVNGLTPARLLLVASVVVLVLAAYVGRG